MNLIPLNSALNKVPGLDKLEKRRGSFVTDGGKGPYLLLDWPVPVHGPAFASFGRACVGCYVIKVLPEESIPVGAVDLAVWADKWAFEKNADPVAILAISDLLDQDPTRQERK